MKEIEKAALLIIEDRKLVVARTEGKDFFIPPGGKPETGETILQAGIREGYEELGISISESDLEIIGSSSAPAAGQEDTIVTMTQLLVKKYTGDLSAQSEVEELERIDSSNTSGLKLGSILEHDILPSLKSQDLID